MKITEKTMVAVSATQVFNAICEALQAEGFSQEDYEKGIEIKVVSGHQAGGSTFLDEHALKLIATQSEPKSHEEDAVKVKTAHLDGDDVRKILLGHLRKKKKIPGSAVKVLIDSIPAHARGRTLKCALVKIRVEW